MDEKYSGNVLPTRAIYPAKFLPYVLLLTGSKFFRSFGVFLLYDLLKLIHHVQFLFFIKSGAAICLFILQKPMSGRRISKYQWFRICRHAIFGTIIKLLWLYGLTLCGPLRTLLMYEHSDVVVIAVFTALFTSSSSPAKFRGAVLFVLAFLCIMLLDHDSDKQHTAIHTDPVSASHRHESFISHIFNHLTNLTGLSDHKAGVFLLFLTLCLTVGYNVASKSLSLDIGGAKRLNALSTIISALLLAPWTTFIFYTNESFVESWLSVIFPIVFVTLTVLVIDYYVESVCIGHLDLTRTGQLGTAVVLGSAVVISFVWNHPFVSQIVNMRHLRELIVEEHEISLGVVFSVALFALAMFILTKPTKGNKGTLVGYSAAGPLYSFAGEAFQRTSHSAFVIAKNGLHKILEESDSRRIFYFLCINMGFTFVELAYGVWTNSLGLISDGFHMFFDCSALVMGLYAAVMSHWKATRIFSYGYDRVEILSGFINGLFLMVIAFFVFVAAFSRLIDPPEIKTDRLLFVSVGGFCVNMVGIIAFRHNHSHGGGGHNHGSSSSCGSQGNLSGGSGGHGHSHGSSSGGHGHSHAGSGHGHSHASSTSQSQQVAATHNTNMEGVFLHVLADTLGSVGVIISTLLIQNFGWKIADPICSIFISILIFVSVLPLVKETSCILLLKTPEEIQQSLARVLQKILSIEGVMSYSGERFWRHSSTVVCGTIHIQVQPDSMEQKIISQIASNFKDIGIGNLCIQVEKRTYVQHLSGLGVNDERIQTVMQNFCMS